MPAICKLLIFQEKFMFILPFAQTFNGSSVLPLAFMERDGQAGDMYFQLVKEYAGREWQNS